MALPTSIKYQAFELILHGYGWRTIQHELGVSKGAIDAWRNFIESGDFSWIRIFLVFYELSIFLVKI